MKMFEPIGNILVSPEEAIYNELRRLIKDDVEKGAYRFESICNIITFSTIDPTWCGKILALLMDIDVSFDDAACQHVLSATESLIAQEEEREGEKSEMHASV